MELKNVLKELQASKEFKDWHKEHKDSILAHAFMLLDDANKDTWQLGFYNKDNTITTFMISPKVIEVIPNQEILRSEQEILRLDTEISVDYEVALKTASDVRVVEHPREIPLKTFFIIQQLESGPVYNITFFFQSMKTLNVKVSAKDGKVVSSSCQSLMEFDKPLKK
jgi:hypothetical protein